jgi:cardiolipin synthase
VLIDGLGSWYSLPPIVGLLRKRGISVARFLYSFVPWRMPYLNLRNHPKILVTDGQIGFTGGMNIAEGNLVLEAPPSPIMDTHFRLEGPVVGHLMETFAEDWLFTTGERLEGTAWFPSLHPAGAVFARGIGAGPDEEFDKLRWTLLGAVSEARAAIKILTPYFLPDEVLVAALRVAAMRGVAVDIVLPERSNLAFVDWAAAPRLDEILTAGCRIWLSAPSFDHSKLMLVDGAWAMFGSTNWDSRSLRLNFEFNVECYDRDFADRLNRLIDGQIAKSRALTLAELTGRSLPVKLRDGIARLFSPYL